MCLCAKYIMNLLCSCKYVKKEKFVLFFKWLAKRFRFYKFILLLCYNPLNTHKIHAVCVFLLKIMRVNFSFLPQEGVATRMKKILLAAVGSTSIDQLFFNLRSLGYEILHVENLEEIPCGAGIADIGVILGEPVFLANLLPPFGVEIPVIVLLEANAVDFKEVRLCSGRYLYKEAPAALLDTVIKGVLLQAKGEALTVDLFPHERFQGSLCADSKSGCLRASCSTSKKLLLFIEEILDSMGESVVLTDLQRNVVTVNKKYLETFDVQRRLTLYGRDYLDVARSVLASSIVMQEDAIDQLACDFDFGTGRTENRFLLGADGRSQKVQVRHEVFPSVGHIRYIKNLDEIQGIGGLLNEGFLGADILEQCPIGFILVDSKDWTVQLANRQARELLGIEEASEVIGCSWRETIDLFLGRHRIDYSEEEKNQRFFLDAHKNSGFENLEEYHLQKEDGTSRWVLGNTALIRGLDGQVVAAILAIQDITEVKKREEKLSIQATHDGLTLLPNRALLNDRFEMDLARARREQRSGALMFIDLDNFKQINDVYGHDVGDNILMIVAERLKGEVRSYDTVARIGGDEFCVLLPNVESLDILKHLAERIRESLTKPCCVAGWSLTMTASIGIACYPHDGDSLGEIMKAADVAMYEAKTSGKNMWCFCSNPMEILPAVPWGIKSDVKEETP